MKLERVIRAANRRLLRPWANEARRLLAGKLHAEQTVVVNALGEFRFRVAGAIEIGRTLDYGHEMISLASFLFLLKSDDIVWDVGASVGLFTVHCAARAGQVVAFEPDPATLRRNQENVALNGLSGKVVFQPVALGETSGELELQSDGLDGCAPTITNLGRHRHSLKVQVETMDRLIEAGVPAPSVLKIDIEGAEIVALRGAGRLLASTGRPRLVFVEMHPQFLPSFGSNDAEAISLLRSAGYQIVSTQARAEQYHLIAVAPPAC